MNSDTPMNLEEIFDTIMYREAKPTHEALERWIARFPEHKAELAKFFSTWAEQSAIQEETPIDEETISSRLVSHALNLAYLQTASTSATLAESEPSRLSKAIALRGMNEAEFAGRCKLDNRLVAKLDRRLIRYDSIPEFLIRVAAEVLRFTQEFIRSLFAAEPIPVQRYKSKKKPVLKTEDFLDAVQASGLSPEVKAEWVRVIADESERKGKK